MAEKDKKDMVGHEAGAKHDKKKEKQKERHEKHENHKRRRRSRATTPDGSAAAPARKRHRETSPPPWVPSVAAAHVSNAITVKLEPTSMITFGMGTTTPYTVTHVAQEMGSRAALSSALVVSAEIHPSLDEPWAAGEAWGLAFSIKHTEGADQSGYMDKWQRCRTSGGNMLYTFAADNTSIALFFAAYPKAAACIPVWTSSSTPSGNMMNPLLLISAIAEALGKSGDMISGKMLAQALDKPHDMPSLLRGLRQLPACQHAHAERGSRLKKIASKLEDNDDEKAFEQIMKICTKWSAAVPQASPVPTPVVTRPAAAAALPTAPHELPTSPHDAVQSHAGPVGFTTPPPPTALPPASAPVSFGPSPAEPGAPMRFSPAPEPGQQLHGGSRSGGTRMRLQVETSTYQDLRESCPMDDPDALNQAFGTAASNPVSPVNTEAFLFSPPTERRLHVANSLRHWRDEGATGTC